MVCLISIDHSKQNTFHIGLAILKSDVESGTASVTDACLNPLSRHARYLASGEVNYSRLGQLDVYVKRPSIPGLIVFQALP